MATASLLYDAHSGSTGADGSKSLRYRVVDADSLAAARLAFGQSVPMIHDGFIYKNHSYEEQGFGIWIFTAHYHLPGQQISTRSDDYVVNFDTTGGRARVFYSEETVMASTPPGQVPPIFNGGIGWDGSRFEGVDKIAPEYKWTETHYFPIETVDYSYRRMMRMMTGTVNDRPFRDMLAGEVMFLGVQGQTKRDTEEALVWEMRFSFHASPNLEDLVYGDCAPVNKAGHHYLWIYTAPQEDAGAKKVVGKPAAVFVERVYRETNFANIGIGDL